MKLRFIYKYKGNKVEHDKFLHCKNQISNQNLHAIIPQKMKKGEETKIKRSEKFLIRHFDANLSEVKLSTNVKSHLEFYLTTADSLYQIVLIL